MYYYHIMI